MDTTPYLSGEYLAKHPTWHVEDSDWKVTQVLNMLDRHALDLHSIVEIGCGAGEILSRMQRRMGGFRHFSGYEISPQALALCKSRANERLTFHSGDGLAEGEPVADLALALDVVEHVEDYPAFLRSMRRRARFCIFHIPLDLSVLSLLTDLPLRVRRSAGHLHYFTRELVLEALTENGLRVIDHAYTRPAIERPSTSLRASLARWPRIALASINESLASTLLGGFSLLILAESRQAQQPTIARPAIHPVVRPIRRIRGIGAA